MGGGQDEEAATRGVLPMLLCLIVSIWMGHVVHVRRIAALTEATVSLLVGLAAGAAAAAYYVLWLRAPLPPSLAALDAELVLDMLLPPIIFQAGFSVKKKSFFRNFTTLCLLGVAGTFLTAGLVAAGAHLCLAHAGLRGGRPLHDALSLGVVFSSTDSVAALGVLDQEAQPLLYSLVFGEGVVNDATSVVLLRAIQRISTASQLTGDTLAALLLSFSRLFVLSLLLGTGVGLASAALIKHAFVRHSTDREVTLLALCGALAFLAAEGLGLSGIFSVFFAGISMSHYTWHALSPSAKVVTVYLFRVMSFGSELFLFVYAGFSMWGSTLWEQHSVATGRNIWAAGLLAGALVVLVLCARAVTLLLLVPLANTWQPWHSKISSRQAGVVWWAGSQRGAVTIALAIQSFGGAAGKAAYEQQAVVVLACKGAVIFFTIVLGAATSRLVNRLLAGDSNALASHGTLGALPSIAPGGVSAPMLASALRRGLHWSDRSPVFRAWHALDRRYLQPVFGGRAPQADVYRSPPPSPGQQVVQDVLGPGLMKRLAPAPEPGAGAACDCPPTGRTADAAGDADASAQARAQAQRPPSQLASHKSSLHAQAFGLWPAPSDDASGGGPSRPAPSPANTAAPSVRSARPDAVEMQPSSAVEELFSCGSARLDSEMGQQLDWQDSALYGQDAGWLAAGAPSGSQDQLSLDNSLRQPLLGGDNPPRGSPGPLPGRGRLAPPRSGLGAPPPSLAPPPPQGRSPPDAPEAPRASPFDQAGDMR